MTTVPLLNTSTPLFELSALDAVEWLRRQPAESIDLLITDPAYESLASEPRSGSPKRVR